MANDMMNRRNDIMDAMNDWFGFPRNFFDDSEIENIISLRRFNISFAINKTSFHFLSKLICKE